MKKLLIAANVVLGLATSSTSWASILGSADSFAVLAGSTVTNTENTTINGDIGVWPGTAYTGEGTVTHTGTQHLNDAVAQTAQGDLTTAYNALASMPVSIFGNLTDRNLGGLTLEPGVYNFTSDALLTGTLSLDAQGNNNEAWVFQIGTALITAPNSAVQFINLGTNNGLDNGIFWQVGSSATIGSLTAFKGNILADQSVTINTGATLDGRALARIAAVTMQGNTINNGLDGGLVFDGSGNVKSVPEPGTLALFGLGLLGVLGFKKKNKVA